VKSTTVLFVLVTVATCAAIWISAVVPRAEHGATETVVNSDSRMTRYFVPARGVCITFSTTAAFASSSFAGRRFVQMAAPCARISNGSRSDSSALESLSIHLTVKDV